MKILFCFSLSATLILFFILINAIDVTAQNSFIDSLQNALSKSKDDTNKLIVLDAIIEMTDDDSIGKIYNEQMGKLSQSLMQNKSKAIQYAAKKYSAHYFNNAGYYTANEGKYPVALDYYYKSLGISEALNEKQTTADALINIGQIKSEQRDWHGALEIYYKSLKFFGNGDNNHSLATLLNNMGTIYNTLGNTDSAFHYFEKSLKVCEAIDDKETMDIALSNIGGVYKNLNDFTHALEYYKKAYIIQQEIGDVNGIYTSQVNFGSIAMKQNNYNEAEKYFLEAMKIARETGSSKNIYGAANWLSQVYNKEKKYQQAFEMLALYKEMSDSAVNEETRKQTVKKQFQYEYEKKEAVMKVLQEKRDALAKQEIEKQKTTRNAVIGGSVGFAALSVLGFFLYRANRIKKENELKRHAAEVDMKALRSQMNPHFIFNSLNSIQNFINSNDSENANEYLVKFAKLVRMILENSRKQEIALSEDLKALELYMQLESLRLKKGFDYELKIEDAVDRDNVLVPPLIIQPFVENAIWHGLQYKKEKGKIIVAFGRKENELVCTVEDNGVGREAASIAKQKTNPGKRHSLGMQITKERINLYNNLKNTNAFFEITDITNNENNIEGVRVIVHLPFEEAI